MNKSAIDRGLFSSTYYRTYKEQCNKNHSNGEEEFFTSPNNNTKGVKPFNYDKLNSDGFVPENTFVDSGDIIIGKCMPQKIDTVITYKDTSVSLKNNESGYIDKNSYGDKYFTNVNGDGYNFAKVRLRNMRVPTIGDKFCFTNDHEILTDQGWVNLEDIQLTDRVASLVEGKVVYQNPVDTQKFRHIGEVYKVGGINWEITVTPNHRMYVSTDGITYKMELADKIGESERYYSVGLEQYNEKAMGYWEIYDDYVYCCTVEQGEGIIFVRKTGQQEGVWTGNSSRHGHLVGCEK